MNYTLLNPQFDSAARNSMLLTLILLWAAACSPAERIAPAPAYEPSEPNITGWSPDAPYPEENSPADISSITDNDIEEIIASMSLREKAAQLFVIPVQGIYHHEEDQRYREWVRLIKEWQVGGLIFMGGDIYGQAVLANRLQSESSIPLWMTQDMEFGAAMRVRGTTRFTPAMGIAATGNPELARWKGIITAREAKSLGIHQIFAPVLDVNNNPANPVINVRSYSADPDTVALYANAFIEGVESVGIMATGKHFPGHGDTNIDSHLALPVIHHDYSRIDTLELSPFRSAIDAGLRSIMSAHIAFPAFGTDPGLPGTLDPGILGDILADSLGFKGLVVTDGLEMSGITSRYSPGEAAVLAIRAGSDILLISPDEMTAILEVVRAVESGELSEERLDLSVRKLLTLKRDHGLFENRGFTDPDSLHHRINTPPWQAVADRIARESVTLLKDEKSILPITEQKAPRILFIAVSDDATGDPGAGMLTELRKYHPNVVRHLLDPRTGTEEKLAIAEAAQEADLILIGSFIYVRSHQPIQMAPEKINFLNTLIAGETPSMLVSFGNPYLLMDLPGTDASMIAWSAASEQVSNTIPALFGAATIRGRLPIDIPGYFNIGDGLSIPRTRYRIDRPEAAGMITHRLMELDEIMHRAVDDSITPGGVVAVLRKGVLVWNRGYGYHDYEKINPVRETDVYDLASMTKIMATTTAVMKLVEEHSLHPGDRVSRYIPEFDTEEKREITIEHLLLHTSGLPAFRVYVDRLKTREEILHAIRNEPLEHEPGERYLYSDLGFILLAEIVEEVSGEPIDRFIRNHFFRPMGMESARFNPTAAGDWMTRRIPPTEIDTVYGRGRVSAEVHDERAWFMEGVAGHAGLFASARDVAAWAQMLLNGGLYQGTRYLLPETIDLFTGRRSPLNQRGYGFDRKSEGFSTAGRFTGMDTFGHLGFTGTSVWIDPDEEIAIILLTNRTWPDRNRSDGIRELRAAISDQVMQSIEQP
ncbi:MAG: glycoside hydrolase family 3 N-terminal domain-containing protein [Balneolaceae bacterium]